MHITTLKACKNVQLDNSISFHNENIEEDRGGEILSKLLLKYPHWELVVRLEDEVPNDGIMQYLRVADIKASTYGEDLGGIYCGYGTYYVSGWRIAKSMVRKRSVETASVARVMREVGKNFKARNPRELCEEWRHQLSTTVSSARRECFDYTQRTQLQKWMANVGRELESNPDAFLHLRPEGMEVSAAKDLCSNKTRHDTFDAVDTNLGSDGVLLTFKSGFWNVTKVSNGDNYRAKELPTECRTRVGMLKLLPNGGASPHVGVKVSETKFYLIEEEYYAK